MVSPRPPITPATRVGDLLDAYPELEEVLVGLAPAFAKLRNPVLRRTVARVATLEQAARIGGLSPRDLVRQLRRAAGQDDAPLAGGASGPIPAAEDAPGWVDEANVATSIDADALLDRGEHPLGAVRAALPRLPPGGLLRLDSSFVPAPLLDALRSEGYDVCTVSAGGWHRTYVRRP